MSILLQMKQQCLACLWGSAGYSCWRWKFLFCAETHFHFLYFRSLQSIIVLLKCPRNIFTELSYPKKNVTSQKMYMPSVSLYSMPSTCTTLVGHYCMCVSKMLQMFQNTIVESQELFFFLEGGGCDRTGHGNVYCGVANPFTSHQDEIEGTGSQLHLWGY